MTARLLAAVVALSLIFSTCLAEDDLGKDFDQKAAKAEEAQLATDWAKLEACAALRRYSVAERQQAWRVYLPKFEDLAARRYAARSDAKKLAELDVELEQLFESVSTYTATDPDSPRRAERQEEVDAIDAYSLSFELRDAVDALEEKHGADHPVVKAGRERLRDYQRASDDSSKFWDVEYSHDRIWEMSEQLREYTREYDAALKEQSAAEAAHKAAVKALDDHLANAPGADATEAIRDAYDDKTRELSSATERADNKFRDSEQDSDIAHQTVRDWQHKRDQARLATQYYREASRELKSAEWFTLNNLTPDELATATHLVASASRHTALDELATAVSVTHLELSTFQGLEVNGLPTALEALETVGKLATLKSLKVLMVSGSFDQEMLKPLAKLKGLEELSLYADTWPDPACLSELAAFKNCRIRLMGSLGGNPVASHLKHLAGASELVLEFTGWPAEKGLGEALGSLSNLTRLSLPAASETNAALNAKKLHTVRADKLDAELVKALKAHPAITTLDLTDSNVSSADLALLTDLPHLKQLVLSGCLALDEFALPPLRKLGHLESIDLTATPIRLWAIRLLKHQMPKLKVLH